MLAALRIERTTRGFLRFLESTFRLSRYDKLVLDHQDLREFEIEQPTGEIIHMSIKEFYNHRFLPIARKFITRENLGVEAQSSEIIPSRSEQETYAERLLNKMQLNSPLKESVPSYVGDKSKSKLRSTFTYNKFSPTSKDFLISNSPDPRGGLLISSYSS
jgi:hypothetical protein